MYRQHDMRQTRGRHDTGAWHATPRVSLGPTRPSSPQCWKGFLLMQWGTRWSSCWLAFRSRVVTKTSFLWAHRIHTQPRETRIVPKSLCQTRVSQFSGHSFSTCSQQHSALRFPYLSPKDSGRTNTDLCSRKLYKALNSKIKSPGLVCHLYACFMWPTFTLTQHPYLMSYSCHIYIT